MGENYQNNLLWQKVSIYSDNSFQLKTARSKIDVDLPLNLLNLNIEDENLFKEQKIRRFLVEPKLRFQYHLTALWQTRFSIKYTNRFSDINQLHYGNILRNYRTLQINDASLPETTSLIYSSSFSYRNPISSVFFNTSYGFTSSTYNVLTQTEVQENGNIIIRSVDGDNKGKNHIVSVRLGKLLNDLRTSISMGGGINLSNRQRIINNALSSIKNQSYFLNTRVNTKLTKWVTIHYQTEFSLFNTKVEKNAPTEIFQQKHKAELSLYPWESHFVGISGEYYRNAFLNSTSKALFADVKYRYSIPHSGMDIEAKWVNLFNNEAFVNYFTDSFTVIQNSYQLRTLFS